jgi:hypothetical protein
MMTILADHNIEGYALLLFSALQAREWAKLLDLRLVTFADIGMSEASSDRAVWRRAQELGALLLTDNRNMSGLDSLEQTLRDENTPAALPVVTVSRVKRISERVYRDACADRLATIVADIDQHLGSGRLFIP